MIQSQKYARVIERTWQFNRTDLVEALRAHVKQDGKPGEFTIEVHEEPERAGYMGHTTWATLIWREETEAPPEEHDGR